VRKIALSKRFTKKLKKLTPEKFNMVSVAMGKFEKGEDETLGIHKLKGTFKNFWSFDADYDLRIIYSVNKNGSVILHILETLGTHSELYGQ